MIFRASFLTLLAVFAYAWVRQDFTDDMHDLWVYEAVRTCLWFAGPVLASLSVDEWVRGR